MSRKEPVRESESSDLETSDSDSSDSETDDSEKNVSLLTGSETDDGGETKCNRSAVEVKSSNTPDEASSESGTDEEEADNEAGGAQSAQAKLAEMDTQEEEVEVQGQW